MRMWGGAWCKAGSRGLQKQNAEVSMAAYGLAGLLKWSLAFLSHSPLLMLKVILGSFSITIELAIVLGISKLS